MTKQLSLTEIANRINAHLKRFEADPKINALQHKTRPYYYAGAYRAGRFVNVIYVTYQGSSSLGMSEAVRYLAWLDKGNIGRHYEALTS